MHQNAPREYKQAEQESFGELLSRLAMALAGLVRDEINLARQEIREKIKLLRTGMIMTAIAVLLGFIALFTLDAALVIGIGNMIGFGLSALVIGIAVAIIAGIFAGLGISQLRKTKLKPEATIRSLQENREWLRKIT